MTRIFPRILRKYCPRISLATAVLAAATAFCPPAQADAAAGSGYFDGRSFPIVTDPLFTADEYILTQAHFWYDIYMNVGEDEGLLHDPMNPELVFRKVKVGEAGGRAGRRAVEAQVNALKSEILDLLAKDSTAYTEQERRLKARFPSHWDSTAIRLCVDRLRFQRGLKNKFRQGLERSFRYLPLIDSVMAARNLPTRLKYLPHVESSFYPHAYSKVGAAGMWQFMKSSAKHFSMKAGYLIDERRDPVRSTEAAASMMAYNFNLLKSWPLTIVAYNHGGGGMAKAARTTGSTDLGTVIKSYYSNSFGFASKNFYAEFLAASSIAIKADSLFPNLRKLEPLSYQTLVLSKPCGTRALCTLTGLSPEELEEYNLALRPATFRGNTQLPKGLAVKLPISLDLAAVTARLGAPGASVELALASATAVGSDSRSARAATAVHSGHPPVQVAMAGTEPRKPRASSPRPSAIPAPVAADPRAGESLRPASPEPAVTPEIPVGRDRPSGPAQVAVRPSATPGLLSAWKGLPAVNAPGAPIAPAGTTVKTPKGLAAAIASEPGTAPAANPAVPAPVAAVPAELVVDSTFALQASDLDKLAHPMDRFNPSIYNLGYTYAKGFLTIQAGTEETLSHYAEWAWIPERNLRALNRLRSSRGLRIGQNVRIPMPQEKVTEFVGKREEYYRAMEEDFYGSYYVSALEPLKVSKGMNLWSWAQEKEIPFWLLQKHNPGRVLSALRPGDSLNVPLIETGIRKWGFTRYGNSKEYLAGISQYMYQ